MEYGFTPKVNLRKNQILANPLYNRLQSIFAPFCRAGFWDEICTPK
ncbi:hypothetical protein DBT_0666 [Dissulfuribacter thermophilus]|uniref:Uncharacterized protein n=1 Tax=Dissulfuribacter thermophilus TaxID=1156395 RepID=A0A1B9F7J9_9BACT|nr:hypothetical protein DBT_0666 [Dissulfuribacter thermophilus]